MSIIKRFALCSLLASVLFIPSFAQHFLGAFSGLVLHIDTQIESPARNNNGQTLPEQKVGDTIQFQFFVPAGAGRSTNGYTVELDLPGKVFSNYIGRVSGADWNGATLFVTNTQLSALFVTGATVPSTGYLGRIDLEVKRPLENGAILTVKSLTITSGGDIDELNVSNAMISFTASTTNPGDFDGNGNVNLADFLEFVSVFGKSSSDAGFDARMDFDGNGNVNLVDFLEFVSVFGKTYPTGGGQSGRADLIVESPSVSKNSLNPDESFTLWATVRNRGDVSAAATTLRYYRSNNATITNSDTQVGNDVVGSLAASRASNESISLTAPSSAGTYYYGACVDPVSGESNTNNNCSTGVQIIVSGGDILGSGEIRRLTYNSAYDGATSWSPDGRSIAFTSERNGNREIYVMGADGSNQHNLTNNSGNEGDPSWSPDGRSIALSSDRDGNFEIYVMGADGSNQRNLTNNSGNDGGPTWSPDNRSIALFSDRDGNFEIYVMGADGSNQRNLTNNSADDADPSWSPDGRSIAFTSWRNENGEIYVMNSDGSNQRRLTNNNAHDRNPSWSPDGRFIAFTSWRDGNAEIYVMNSDGSNQRRLTNNSADDGIPSWSPDGRSIAFASWRNGNAEIYVMDLQVSDGGNGSSDPDSGVSPGSFPVDNIPDRPSAIANTAQFNARSRWQKSDLTYFISNFSPDLPQGDQHRIIGEAFARWASVSNLNFSQVSSRGNADIIIGFGSGAHCNLYDVSGIACGPSPFDGEGATLAHAYFPGLPSIEGDIHFDEDETWAVNPSFSSISFFSVAIHEIGHSLGLEHSKDQAAVMFASYDHRNIKTELAADDIRGIQSLYGGNGVAPPPPPGRPEIPPSPPTSPSSPNDSDNDGLEDFVEVFYFGTAPNNPDTDRDGLLDSEVLVGLNPLNPDTDGDGITDGDELRQGTNPLWPDVRNPGGSFAGTYVGTDYHTSSITISVRTDGSVVGLLRIVQFGYPVDIPLFGSVNNLGQIQLISSDYFWSFVGVIQRGVASGQFQTAGGAIGTWSATWQGPPSFKSTGPFTRGNSNNYQPPPNRREPLNHKVHYRVK